MRIINVVEIVNGVLNNIESFVMTEKSEDDFTPKKMRIWSQAERLFKDLAIRNKCHVDELEDAVDNGGWDNKNGYEVLLVWSDNVNI